MLFGMVKYKVGKYIYEDREEEIECKSFGDIRFVQFIRKLVKFVIRRHARVELSIDKGEDNNG